MATIVTDSHRPKAGLGAEPATAGIPRTLLVVLLGSLATAAGILWDISWHKTIGRDSFWTPAHVTEQLGALLAGVSCGWLVLHTTFAGTPEQRAASVRFWGFRGPLGAWVTIWGAFAMLTSAPFDNWWHNAYGLDVRIVSPPHMVLAAGIISLEVGAMLLVLAAQNRATDPGQVRKLGWAFAFAGGVVLAMIGTMLSDYSSRANDMHRPLFYQVAGVAFPIFLAAFARSGRLRYPATVTAAMYMGIICLTIWILQLFPAQPMLAPIYNVVTHMVPPEFPLLLVLPAFAIDLLVQRARAGRGNDWLLATQVGVSFMAVLFVAQWFFGEFLLSPAARNFFFGADQWAYMVKPGPWQYRFWQVPTDAAGNVDGFAIGRGVAVAALIAVGSARVGLWWGSGMSRVMR
jgi:hypothetical protein